MTFPPRWKDSLPAASRHACRSLVVLLFVIKMVVTVWNGFVFDGTTYDTGQHAERAESAGLVPHAKAYNPPLYYLPVLVIRPLYDLFDDGHQPSGVELVRDLAKFNMLYLGGLYALWLFLLLPRLLPDYRGRTVASVLLLALPGFQKLAMATTPDNLVGLLTAAALAVWLPAFHADRTRVVSWKRLALVALLAGLLGCTRPFAIPAVVVLWGATLVLALRGRRWLSRNLLALSALATVLAAAPAGAWYTARLVHAGVAGPVYPDGYAERIPAHRKNYDYVHHYTSFYLLPLLKVPNREITKLLPGRPSLKNEYANSVLTIFHSEIWGDHWLYFSGKKDREGKLWPKRILLACTLPVMPLVWLRFFLGIGTVGVMAVRGLRANSIAGAMRRAWQYLDARAPQVVVFALLLLGGALYLYWAHSAFDPGRNTTTKFTYTAHLFPLLFALAFRLPLSNRAFNAWLGYLLAVWALALPVAMWWPAW
jgi:hypothetical protein